LERIRVYLIAVFTVVFVVFLVGVVSSHVNAEDTEISNYYRKTSAVRDEQYGFTFKDGFYYNKSDIDRDFRANVPYRDNVYLFVTVTFVFLLIINFFKTNSLILSDKVILLLKVLSGVFVPLIILFSFFGDIEFGNLSYFGQDVASSYYVIGSDSYIAFLVVFFLIVGLLGTTGYLSETSDIYDGVMAVVLIIMFVITTVIHITSFGSSMLLIMGILFVVTHLMRMLELRAL